MGGESVEMAAGHQVSRWWGCQQQPSSLVFSQLRRKNSTLSMAAGAWLTVCPRLAEGKGERGNAHSSLIHCCGTGLLEGSAGPRNPRGKGKREGSGAPLQCSCLENPMDTGAWWAAAHGVAKSRTRLSSFTFTFHFHALEKETATHSSVLAWRIPGMGEPGGLPSTGLHRVGHD